MAGKREQWVIVGAGMAGARMVEEILRRDASHCTLTLIGAETHAPYDRIQLSPVLAGEKRVDDIMTHTQAWYDDHGVRTLFGHRATAILPDARQIRLDDGREISYDKLILATGSQAVRLPLPGADLPGVIAFRDLNDVEAMLRYANPQGEAVVIGGGLLGLEAACGLARRGMKTTVVHLAQVLMNRQLDTVAGQLLEMALLDRGVISVLNAQSQCILGDSHVQGLQLQDGRILRASLIVMAVGIRPCVEPAKSAGLHVEHGIVVDDQMRTADPAIFAVGECVQHRGTCYGLVAPIWEMCRTLADVLTGADPTSRYCGSTLATRLKVSGIDLFSAGRFSGGEDCEDIILRDPARGIYKRLVMQDDQVVGTVLIGDASDSAWYAELIEHGQDTTSLRNLLIFGQATAQALTESSEPLHH